MEDEDNNQILDEKSKTKRKLASVQIISDIIPHTNPKAVEKFEIAKILGWQVVIPKGEFQKNGQQFQSAGNSCAACGDAAGSDAAAVSSAAVYSAAEYAEYAEFPAAARTSHVRAH